MGADRRIRRKESAWRGKGRPPHESSFSRAFAEFAGAKLAERAHEALVKAHLGAELIGHISRDGTAIEAREQPLKRAPAAAEPKPGKAKRGRPEKGEKREAAPTRIVQQLKQPLAKMFAELPTGCDRGTKSNAQGYKNNWNVYKRHIDTADCGVPVSALLTSASVHDSQTAVPLALMTQSWVTHGDDLMDAA